MNMAEPDSSCVNCYYSKMRLHDLVIKYEQLLASKDEQIICSHRIIDRLQKQLRNAKDELSAHANRTDQQEKQYQKVITEHEETVEYLKQRQQKLIEQLKENETKIFKLNKDKEDSEEIWRDRHQELHRTPKKNVGPHLNCNVTLNKENSGFDRFMQSSIQKGSSNNKEGLQLKVSEDKLRVLDIKYKMALLRTVEIATLK